MSAETIPTGEVYLGVIYRLGDKFWCVPLDKMPCGRDSLTYYQAQHMVNEKIAKEYRVPHL